MKSAETSAADSSMEFQSQFSRLFTVNEANLLLPTLRPLIKRILDNLRQLKSKSEVVVRHEQLDPDAPNFMERLRKDEDVSRFIEAIKTSIEEIHSHGCVCKGVEQGLIDFPCMLGAEIVFLCWQFDEPAVAHWHRIEDGFAGRRELIDAADDPEGSFH